jgi:putative glutamine amidotransferase
MENRKIYIVSNERGQFKEYINWIDRAVETKDMKEADIVMFTGGEDVTPALYNEDKHPQTGNNIYRDLSEEAEFKRARRLGKKLLGICRGSQFLCVMAGGKLVQHQYNPDYLHTMLVSGPQRKILISSTHHQAQFPFNLEKDEYKIIGWTKGMSAIHQGADFEEMNPEVECEIVAYPKINALGIQGHPEKLVEDKAIYKFKYEDAADDILPKEIDRTLEYCNELVNKLLDNKL